MEEAEAVFLQNTVFSVQGSWLCFGRCVIGKVTASHLLGVSAATHRDATLTARGFGGVAAYL